MYCWCLLFLLHFIPETWFLLSPQSCDTPALLSSILHCCSVTQPCLIVCNPMNGSTPGFPVLHRLPEFAQTHVHWFRDVIQPPHPLKSFNQFSCLVVSNSLWPHGLQHTRLPCPSPTPRACSNSCPSRWGCHPTLSSAVSSSRILSCSLTWVPLHLNHTFYLHCSATCSGICLPLELRIPGG